MYTLDLTDNTSKAKITGTKSRAEVEEYFDKRELGKHQGTICYQLDGNIKVDATDLKGHHITGMITKKK